ncbi:MAG: SRPBCC family protein [Solirubrobacterales bacterium]
MRRTLAAPRERVFEAWLDPELLRQWLTGPRATSHRAEVDPRVGGEFRVTITSHLGGLLGRLPGSFDGSVEMVGRYLEISPPERLVFSFGWENFPTVHVDPEATVVTVEFHQRDDGTEIVLTHERQPNRRLRAFHSYGWRGSLRKLDALLQMDGQSR